MGYSLSWAALKGGSLENICAATGLVASGRFEEIAESEFVAAPLPTDWYLFLSNGQEIPEGVLSELSSYGEVVGCFIEEQVMFSLASGWKSREKVWHVEHYGGDKGIRHLQGAGELPLQLEEIRRALSSRQDLADAEDNPVDYFFEIPIEVAKAVTGFRHAPEIAGMSPQSYEILEFPEQIKHDIVFGTALRRVVRREKHGTY